MPLVPLNSRHNLRQDAPITSHSLDGGVTVNLHDEDKGNDVAIPDFNGNITKIEHSDGSVTISIDGTSLDADEKKKNLKWFDNLAEHIADTDLSSIAEELMRSIDEDQRSREEWLQQRADGIKLLGFKIEMPGLQGASDGAPVEGMSKVRHPLLQEAVLRFQANARAELLPTDGPVKVRNDNNLADLKEDELGNALEKDANHYLTVTASEYYPDTDRMLLMLGFGGTAFKKVYFCPLRNRPVSETVDAEDVIVNDSASDLRNAKRITHRTYMTPNVVRRLQILGIYRDVQLATPLQPTYDVAQQEKRAQQGVTEESGLSQDRDREILECYCELDIPRFAHKYKGRESGLAVPYRVTIDKSSKHILSIVRNYDEDTKELPVANSSFVKYTYVPGMGFYDIGLLHILGNTTNALTAILRELVDAGMFACFPGFLISDGASSQKSNIFRVAPGAAAQVKTNGQDIRTMIMPLPYKEPSPALVQLMEQMVADGMRIGGISEQAVGEGRADAPVGTTLAMIEQATKVLNSVHKRLHAAQAEEFRLLFKVFKEHPESFWQNNRKPARQWDEQTFIQALEDNELTPQADPNTSSHGQRVMKIQALMLLEQAAPTLYDPVAIHTAALQAIGWNNPQQFFAPPDAQAKMPPEMQKMQAETQAKMQEVQAKLKDADSRATLAQAKVQEVKAKSLEMAARVHMDATQAHHDRSNPEQPEDNSLDAIKAHATLMDAQTRAKLADTKQADIAIKAHMDAADRQSREKVEMLEMAKEIVLHPQEAPIAQAAVGKADSASKPKRKARGLGGAVIGDFASNPASPVPTAEEILQAIDGFHGVARSLREEVNKLKEEVNAEKEVIRNERGRIVGVRRVKRVREE